jgi:predicted dinucleotide-binding enzyme
MQPADIKGVGIIGAGHIGQVMAQIALRAGRQVVIADSRGPESLTSVVQELGEGVSAGTVEDAAAADIVVLAVMWPQVPQAVEGLEWEGRTVIDPTNDFDPSDLNGRTSSEVVADLVAPARVVKAGNTFAAGVLASDPHEAGGQRVRLRRREGRGDRALPRRWVLPRRPRLPESRRGGPAVPRSPRRPQLGPASLTLTRPT